ncbi:hypothetical protein Sya03_59930 [Spirilliplanes yamanashiensis]|uniref:Exo-alpha-sialidase n=1 Tax=Spirilliplanes yamanashiensis TaxID=42233 RepID=A0A8J4DM39_9ACTN|nr:hypothetical protein Sya03_59930 [Spirilliplanes yamanashiensis]
MSSAKTRRPAPARRPFGNHTVLAVVIAAVAAVAIGVAAIVWFAGRAEEGPGGEAAVDLAHVHGLGINPANGLLYAAAHTGLYQLPTAAAATRVGTGEQDTMGFTVVGPNHFLASGHPASHAGGPAHLGLLESTDGGVSWRELSLRGGADFHALRYRHGLVYGYNSTTGELLVSADKTTWETRSTTPLRDFAVDPADADGLLATTEQGLARSADGGRTWTATGEPALLLDWTATGALWAVAVDGTVRHSTDSARAWSTRGSVPGTATAFAADGENLYVAVADRGVLHSSDGGQKWTQLYPRP